MMIKKMTIEIPIDIKQDTPEDVEKLVFDIMDAAGDRFFYIESISVDGVENFKVGEGFKNDWSRKKLTEVKGS